MTRRAIRLWLVSWLWERRELPHERRTFAGKLNAITNVLRVYIYHPIQVGFESQAIGDHGHYGQTHLGDSALPDFDTFQIVRIPTATPYLIGWDGWMISDDHIPPIKRLEWALRG